MEIGTAAVTKQEMEGIEHHLIGFVDPKKQYSVSEYKKDALNVIRDIASRGKLPIIVGGTGLYIDSLIYDMDFTAAAENAVIRTKWQRYVDELGIDSLHYELEKVDPESACRIHVNDVKRVIRALEVYEVTGIPMSNQKNGKVPSQDISPSIISLECENREYLYDRINRRVDIMIKNGLISEIQALLNNDVPIDSQSMKAIGYRQLIPCLTEGKSLDNAISEVKMESRRYAKRQLTWMRKRDCIRIDIENKTSQAVIDEAKRKLKEFGCGFARGEF